MSIIDIVKNFTRIFDYILSRIVIFALSFIWCRYYLDSLFLSVLASAGITLCISFIFALILKPGKRRKAVSKAVRQHREEVINQFMYSTNQRNIEYFYNLIKTEYHAALLPECILSENKKVKTLIFTRFRLLPANQDDIREVITECRCYGAERAIVFGSAFNDKAKETALKIEGLEVVLMNAESTYNFIKELGAYPVIAVKTTQNKRKPLKVFFKFAFSRTKVKAYLLGAAIMILCSFLVRYNLYYLISATAFLFFALLSFINFGFKREPEKSLL